MWQYDFDDERQITAARVWAADGSVASVDGDTVAEAGPRGLWSLLESAYRAFDDAGHPSADRYGITVDGPEQWVWLETPGGLRWKLNS